MRFLPHKCCAKRWLLCWGSLQLYGTPFLSWSMSNSVIDLKVLFGLQESVHWCSWLSSPGTCGPMNRNSKCLCAQVSCFSSLVLVWHMKFEDFEVLNIFWLNRNWKLWLTLRSLGNFRISPVLPHLETNLGWRRGGESQRMCLLSFSSSWVLGVHWNSLNSWYAGVYDFGHQKEICLLEFYLLELGESALKSHVIYVLTEF